MRLACAVLVVVAACSDKASEPIVEIRLPRVQPVKGEQILEVEDHSMAMTFTMQGRPVDWEYHRRGESLGRTMAVDGYAVTVAEVTYKSIDETSKIDGKTQSKSDPRLGRTYSLTRRDGELMAIALLGQPASREELDDVVEDNETVGVADEIDAVIASKLWKTGQKIAFTADELTRINQSKPPSRSERKELTAMDLTLRSVKNGVATFAVTMSLRFEGQEGAYEVRMRGNARIELATGHVLELGGSGPLTGTAQGMPVKGTMTHKVISRWVASR